MPNTDFSKRPVFTDLNFKIINMLKLKDQYFQALGEKGKYPWEMGVKTDHEKNEKKFPKNSLEILFHACGKSIQMKNVELKDAVLS